MKTIEQLTNETMQSDRKVEIKDVLKCVLTSIAFLDERSENFARVKANDERGYNGIINTLCLTLVSNIAVLGLGRKEALELVQSLKDECIKDAGIAVVIKGKAGQA